MERLWVDALRYAGGWVSIRFSDGRVDVYEVRREFFTDLARALSDPGWLALRGAMADPGEWHPVAVPTPSRRPTVFKFLKFQLVLDLYGLLGTAVDLVSKSQALRPQLDAIEGDVIALVAKLDFDQAGQLVADLKAAYRAAVEQYGTGDAVVQAFLAAAKKVIADLKGE